MHVRLKVPDFLLKNGESLNTKSDSDVFQVGMCGFPALCLYKRMLNKLKTCSVPEPMALACVGVAADGIILIRQPYNKDDIECCSCVIEKLRHDGFHSCGCDGQ